MSARDVLILLSTHNGAAYLREQLASLRDQTVAERIHLMVRDDGSDDTTVSILTSADTGAMTIQVDHGSPLGARDSFATLMRAAPPTFPVVMFCDQDDLWEPDKVEIARQVILDADPSRPTLSCGRSTIIDQTGHLVGVTEDAPTNLDFAHALFHNIAPGHTMAFNQALTRLSATTIGPYAVMHDWWTYCVAAGLGEVIFDSTPHARYRQHDHNEIGYAAGPVQRLIARARRLLGEDRGLVTRQAAGLRTTIGDRLKPADQAMVAELLDQSSLAKRLAFLRRHPLTTPAGRAAIPSTLLFAAGRYR
ncbi:MAG: glycosyltransferase [Propionibacteriaceae bacterium]|jgi:glycosyltransferase involved in cell wall biosynthesis|nr:glycosyltransferase [Propionibacteriaceae bacterium]